MKRRQQPDGRSAVTALPQKSPAVQPLRFFSPLRSLFLQTHKTTERNRFFRSFFCLGSQCAHCRRTFGRTKRPFPPPMPKGTFACAHCPKTAAIFYVLYRIFPRRMPPFTFTAKKGILFLYWSPHIQRRPPNAAKKEGFPYEVPVENAGFRCAVRRRVPLRRCAAVGVRLQGGQPAGQHPCRRQCRDRRTDQAAAPAGLQPADRRGPRHDRRTAPPGSRYDRQYPRRAAAKRPCRSRCGI